MRVLFLTVDFALEIYLWLLVATIVLAWLTGFNVVGRDNRVVTAADKLLARVVGPALRPIRKVLPDLGGIDVSPIVLIALIIVLRYVLALTIFADVF